MSRGNEPKGPSYYTEVSALCFYVNGDEENLIDSNVNVTNKEVMKNDRPATGGIYDPHMGTTDRDWACLTCGNRQSVCPGHFGSIDLKYPVKSPIYREELLKWLKIICYYCGEIVVPIKKGIKQSNLLGHLVKNSKKIDKCPYCKKPHLTVVKNTSNPVIFYRVEESKDDKKNKSSKIKNTNVANIYEFYNHKIKEVLMRIKNETVLRLGKPLRSHPSKFILQTIRVPPNTIRPDIRRIGGARSSNSDTTSMLKTIVEINESLPEDIPEDQQIMEDTRLGYFNLDISYHTMIKGSGTGDIKLVTNNSKPPVSIAERFPKKTGRIRCNLMGKRVSYMLRSVITGDSRLKINEVGVPMIHARDLEIPETVNEKNIDRLNTYYMNKHNIYPGCKRIIKKSNGQTHRVEKMSNNYQLQMGDIVMRDIIDGDVANLNRQPSLLFSNIASMKIVVMNEGSTLRINPSVCNYFNADFDGDQMNAIIASGIQARSESSEISKVARWFISPQTQAPLVGAFQDGLIGLAELTKNGLDFNKWHAMNVFGDINTQGIDYDFTDKQYTNRSLVSRLLPKINLAGKSPSIYRQEYAGLLKYDPQDINVNIIRGQLKSGILDKATAGQGVMGSIFHIIANEYGNDTALETVYNLQQIVHRFFLYHGFTVGIRDINISETATEEVKHQIATMILESRKITERLNNGKLIAPLGMSLLECYENEQLNALSPGDSFANPTLEDIDLETNGTAKLILTGSKGKIPNFIAINSAIGVQTINGKRFEAQAGWGRTSPYFVRYDTEPAAHGYISTSFREGVTNDVYAFMAGEARHGLISNALSTSITGHQNRVSIKNLETILTDNLRKSTKDMNVVQPLFGECGLDPAKTEKVKFPTVLISDSDFKKLYKTDIKQLDKKFQNKEVEKLLEEEFLQIEKDRQAYRDIHLKLENHNPKEYIMSNSKQMPVNIQHIIDSVAYNYSDMVETLDAKKRILDPVYVIEQVKLLCSELVYAYTNDHQKHLKKPIAKHLTTAVYLLQILLRSYLCTSYLMRKNIINSLLDIIIQRVNITFKKSLIDYGTSVGILAAQCVSEPMTQFVLDSKHRTGGQGGTQTNEIKRIQEVLGARSTEKMENTHMLIMVKPEYEIDEMKVQEIANHLEMIKFNKFINTVHIFYEDYGKPTHPDFKHETDIIKEIEKHNYGQKRPGDLAKWCIRFSIDKEELILKNIKLETIVIAFKKAYQKSNELYLIYSPENADNVFIRCYIRNSLIKKTASVNYYEEVVYPLMQEIQEIVVRGINGLISTSVTDVIKNVLQDDGSLERKKVYGIFVVGTNLPEVLNNPYIDPLRTQSDSVIEMEKVYGIVAARNKITNELTGTMKTLNKIWSSVFADEMSYSEQVTSIQRTGLQARENANITLRLSFQSALSVITSSSIIGAVDKIHGISGGLIMGTVCKAGTTYNRFTVNEDFIKENIKKLESVLEDL